MAPVPKYRQPANKEAHPPAALNPPPPAPPMPSAAQQQAKKVASAVSAAHAEKKKQQQGPIKSVAEEAADKANAKAQAARQARIDALRDKVHGAKGKEKQGEEAAAEDPSKEMSQLSLAKSPSETGLQSPTTGAWRDVGGAGGMDAALRTVQSPTSSSWKPPAETSLAEETFAGARVRSASVEEIKQVEDQEMIKEEPEPDSEENKVKKEKTESEKKEEEEEKEA